MFDPCDCGISGDPEEQAGREVHASNRGGWLRQSAAPTQRFWAGRSSSLCTAHGFTGLDTIALCTAPCFSGCKFGVLARSFKSTEGVLLLAADSLGDETQKIVLKIFPCIIHLSSIPLTPEIYDKQHRVMSSSGSGKSPVPERESWFLTRKTAH